MNELSKYLKFLWKMSLVTFFCFAFLNLSAQKKQKAYISIEYKQVVNEYRLIEVSLRTRVEGKFQPISGAQIDILMNTENDDILLAKIYSDSNGQANMAIDKDYSYFKDEEGRYTLIAKYAGNDSLKKATKKIKARDLLIQANFSTIDSIKTIKIRSFELIKDSLRVPENEIRFEIFVNRLFADLSITKAKLINGKAEVEIPDNIPGDTEGNIQLIVLINERDYQKVELTKKIKWGIPLINETVKKKNATTISYVIFMIVSIIVIALFGLLFSKTISNKS